MADTPLRSMVREAIINNVENGYSDTEVDAGTDAIMRIVESVHENAMGYGRLLGEEAVLDALIEGSLGKAAQRHWWTSVKAKIEAGQQVERRHT